VLTIKQLVCRASQDVQPRVALHSPPTHSSSSLQIREMPGHNSSLAVLGVFILWFGWYGFNPGSALAILGKSTTAAVAAVSTTLSGAAGTLSTLLILMVVEKLQTGHLVWDLIGASNGTLAGLVGVTASCAFVEVRAIPSISFVVLCHVFLGCCAWACAKVCPCALRYRRRKSFQETTTSEKDVEGWRPERLSAHNALGHVVVQLLGPNRCQMLVSNALGRTASASFWAQLGPCALGNEHVNTTAKMHCLPCKRADGRSHCAAQLVATAVKGLWAGHPCCARHQRLQLGCMFAVLPCSSFLLLMLHCISTWVFNEQVVAANWVAPTSCLHCQTPHVTCSHGQR
jgi:hypothetical protein